MNYWPWTIGPKLLAHELLDLNYWTCTQLDSGTIGTWMIGPKGLPTQIPFILTQQLSNRSQIQFVCRQVCVDTPIQHYVRHQEPCPPSGLPFLPPSLLLCVGGHRNTAIGCGVQLQLHFQVECIHWFFLFIGYYRGLLSPLPCHPCQRLESFLFSLSLSMLVYLWYRQTIEIENMVPY